MRPGDCRTPLPSQRDLGWGASPLCFHLLGKIVVADALHTQTQTAQQILYEQGGDYLLTVKGNQPTLQKTLESLFVKQAFSPSTHAVDPGVQAGAQPGASGDSIARLPGSHPHSGGLPWGSLSSPPGDTG